VIGDEVMHATAMSPAEVTPTDALVASVVGAAPVEPDAPKKTPLRIRKSEPGAKKAG
jgi:hypothetical protein